MAAGDFTRIQLSGVKQELLTPTQVAAAIAPVMAAITVADPDHTWWNDWPVPPNDAIAVINRFGGRTFFGAATENDGDWDEGAPPGSPIGFSDLDWLGQYSRVSINGGDGVGLPNQSDVNYGQVVILHDYENTGLTHAGPAIALVAAVRSLNSLDGSTPRVLSLFAMKDHTDDLLAIPVWTIYGEAHNLIDSPGTVFFIEGEVRSSFACATDWTPYNTPGNATVGVALGVGAGLSATGQFPATTAMYFTANPEEWAAGFIFLDGSIGTFGVGGSKPVMMMPYDYSVQWFKSGVDLGASIYSDVNGNLYLTADQNVICSGNIIVGDGAGVVFSAAGDTYITGSSAANVIVFTAGGSERGRFTTAGLDITGSLTVSSSLAVTGPATFDSTADIVGDVVIGGSLEVAANTVLDGTLDVAAAAVLASTLGVTGNTTLTGTLTVNTAGGNVSWSKYTPTLTGVTNVDATTAYEALVLRIGNHCTVWFKADVDTTAGAGTATNVGISLPFASNFAAAEDCPGGANCQTQQESVAILADGGNDRAAMIWNSQNTTNRSFFGSFGYEII